MEALKQKIEDALKLHDPEAIAETIRDGLSQAIRTGDVRLSPRYRNTKEGHYARRLLFSEPEFGYTAVVMTWAPGQGTPVHDHSGMWCVEGVVEGEMNVVRYDLVEENGGLFRFVREEPIRAAIGSSGSLIPSIDYHVLANTSREVSITLHIYGGEMNQCNIYVPRPDGWCERQARSLAYDE